MLWNKTNSEQLVACPTWEKNRLLNWARPQILMVWSTDVVMKNESRGEKSGSFILWTLEVLSAFIRLLLQHLISSARHCWQRLLCHPQHFPQLPGLFEAEERDIYNRVRSEVKTRGLNFSTTLRDYLRFRLEFYGLILLMLYRQFFYPSLSHRGWEAGWRMTKVFGQCIFRMIRCVELCLSLK